MRGKQMWDCRRFDWCRNIPAYAGKTGRWIRTAKSGAEHPRVCGENAEIKIFSGTHVGTSPRMRGKLAILSAEVDAGRNIPAYAGKTAKFHIS